MHDVVIVSIPYRADVLFEGMTLRRKMSRITVFFEAAAGIRDLWK